MCRAEGLEAFRGESSDPLLGLIERMGGFLISDHGGN